MASILSRPQLYLYLLIYSMYLCTGWVGKFCNSDRDCLNHQGRFFGEVCHNNRCVVDGYQLTSDNKTWTSNADCLYDFDCKGLKERCRNRHCVCDIGYNRIHGTCIQGNCLHDSDCVRYNWKRKCENQYCACAEGYHKLHNQCIQGDCINDLDCLAPNLSGNCYNNYCECRYGLHRVRNQCIHGECLDDLDCNKTGVIGDCEEERCVYSDLGMKQLGLIVIVTSSTALVILLGFMCFAKRWKPRQQHQPTPTAPSGRDEHGMTGVFNVGYRGEATAPPMSSENQWNHLSRFQTDHILSTVDDLSTVGDGPPPYQAIFPEGPYSTPRSNKRDSLPSYTAAAGGY